MVYKIAVAGGVFSVLYYLRPLPDLFAALRGDGADSHAANIPAAPPRAWVVPGVILATVVVVGLGLFPGVIWTLARAG